MIGQGTGTTEIFVVFPAFVEPKFSSLCSQEPGNSLYPEKNGIGLKLAFLFLYKPFHYYYPNYA
jgi:hypothetical protein